VSAHAPLLEELDRWQEAGLTADLWLRDDDAAQVTGALERLLGCLGDAAVPAALAVIPMLATEALAKRLHGFPALAVWQHGIAHIDHAPSGSKSQELIGDEGTLIPSLKAAGERLGALFGGQAQPVLVPPWNRIERALIPRLPEAGFTGLSTFKPRVAREAAAGVWQVNTHVDIIDWRAGRKMRDVSAIYTEIAVYLANQRTDAAERAEPLGILTHHLVMQDSAWAFLSDLFTLTNNHPAARWCVPNGA
jgi:hypothetical protein